MQVLDPAGEITFSPMLHRYTLEEFWALPEPADRSHYDLIEGSLFMVPPPDYPHGNIDGKLASLLHAFLTENKLPGQVLHPREGIYKDIHTDTYLEPDMMYVSAKNIGRKGRRRTSADLVFEYSSRSTAIYDRTTKADTYLALGIREVWLIDPDGASIEVRHARRNASGRPVWESRRYAKGEFAESEVLKGWRVSVDELFEGLV